MQPDVILRNLQILFYGILRFGSYNKDCAIRKGANMEGHGGRRWT